MSVINKDLEAIYIDAEIELFKIDISKAYPLVSPNVFYFTSNTQADKTNILYRGITYQPLPIQSDGFEITSNGSLPTPSVRIANVQSIIGDLCDSYNDLKGAKVTRTKTLAKYLDNGATPNPTAYLPEDIYYISQKGEETKLSVVFKLASAFDLEQVNIPSRKIQANFCTATYRNADSGCPYAGPAVADYLDNPTTNSLLDNCGHRLTSCSQRFGPTNILPINCFPASGQN